MKKLLILILTILMAMGLAACSNETKDPAQPTNPAPQEDVVKEDETQNSYIYERTYKDLLNEDVTETVEIKKDGEKFTTVYLSVKQKISTFQINNETPEEVIQMLKDTAKPAEGVTYNVSLEGDKVVHEYTYDLTIFDGSVVLAGTTNEPHTLDLTFKDVENELMNVGFTKNNLWNS